MPSANSCKGRMSRGTTFSSYVKSTYLWCPVTGTSVKAYPRLPGRFSLQAPKLPYAAAFRNRLPANGRFSLPALCLHTPLFPSLYCFNGIIIVRIFPFVKKGFYFIGNWRNFPWNKKSSLWEIPEMLGRSLRCPITVKRKTRPPFVAEENDAV